MNMSKVIIAVPAKGDVAGNLVYLNRAIRFCLLQGKAPIPAARSLYLTALEDDTPEHALAVAAGHAWIDCADEVWVFVDRGLSSGMTDLVIWAGRLPGKIVRAWAFDPERLPATTRTTCRELDLIVDRADESVVLPPVCVRASLAMGAALVGGDAAPDRSLSPTNPVALEPAEDLEGWWIATGINGTVTQGYGIPETLRNLAEAFELLEEPVHSKGALRVKRLSPRAVLPKYMSADAAGLDLHACFTDESMGDAMVLRPGERRMVPCGIAVAIPEGCEGQVRARSGLAMREGLTVLNSPGTIDADYRGELGALLVNLGERAVTIRHGERIAQLVIVPVARVEVEEVPVLDLTERGEGGFGSTGK